MPTNREKFGRRQVVRRRCLGWWERSAERLRWNYGTANFCCGTPAQATKITLPGPFTMTQQARNDFYADEEELAMDYAVAVNEELRALKATGVDVVQLDEPWVRTSPEKAARYGLRAINRALEGIEGPTVVHLCFGYAAVVANKPTGYSFLPQLADTIASQISIEAAQPKLDLGVLRDLAGKKIMLGLLIWETRRWNPRPRSRAAFAPD